MRRLFAAVTPSSEAREHLVAALRPIHAEEHRTLRWTDPENWHLTLAFYGAWPNDPSDLLDHLAAAAQSSGPLELHLAGAGVFSGRTLWVGVGGQTKALTSLMHDCVSLVDDDGSRRRRNRAHLTVARATDRALPWTLDEIAHALAVYRGPSFVADRITLFESFLGEGRSGGPRYEAVDEVAL